MSIFDNEDHARGPVTITFGENGEYQRTFDTWEDLQDAEWGQYLEDNGIDGSVMGHPCEIEHAEFGRVWSDDQLIDFTNNRVDLHIGRDLDRDGNPDISVTTTLAEWNVYDEDGNIIRPDNDILYDQGPYIQRNPVDPSLYEKQLSGVGNLEDAARTAADAVGGVGNLQGLANMLPKTPDVFSGAPGSILGNFQTPDPVQTNNGLPGIDLKNFSTFPDISGTSFGPSAIAAGVGMVNILEANGFEQLAELGKDVVRDMAGTDIDTADPFGEWQSITSDPDIPTPGR